MSTLGQPTPSLDRLETSVNVRAFAHSVSGERRTTATARLLRDYATLPAHLEKAERMADCCDRIWIGMDDEGPCVQVSRCKQRACPECDRIRSRILCHTVEARAALYQHPKFLTLTLRWGNRSLREQIQFLLRCFNRLRRHAVWKQCVRAGMYAVEITRNRRLGSWHVHVHAVLDAKFIAQSWLSDRWREITGGSYIVDIRKAGPGAGKYLSKYVSKGSGVELEPWEEWPYREEIAALRLVGAFGDERAINETEDTTNGKAQPIAPLSVIVERARAGDAQALWTLAKLAERYPYLFGADAPEPERPIPPVPKTGVPSG